MPTARPLLFFVPDPGTTVSGGHLYNEEVVRDLRARGRTVVVAELDQAAALLAEHPDRHAIFDSVYLNGPERAALAALPLEAHGCVFLAHHLHSLFPEDGRSAAQIYEADERPILSRFKTLWATSPFAADYLRSRAAAGQRVITIEPGLQRVVTTSPEVADPPRVLLVANLVQRKGVLPLLEELASRGEDLPPFVLRILGGDLEPEYAFACRAVVRGSRVLAPRVDFAGTLPPDAMPEELAAADVFVSAAAMETFGMAILEARAAGLPVRLLRGGFAEQHLEGGHGRAFDSVTELADDLMALVAAPTTLRAEKRAALDGRPVPRSWHDAGGEVVDQLGSH